MTDKTMEEILGGKTIQEVIEEMDEHKESSKQMDRLRLYLMEQHPNMWVATDSNGLVAVDETLVGVCEKARSVVGRNTFAVEYLDPDPAPMIPSVWKDL